MRSHPSLATVLASLALLVAVGVPAEGAVSDALTSRSVTKIAKKVADKEIKKKAGTLSVAHASSADIVGGIPASGLLRKQPVTMSYPTSGWDNTQPTSVTFYRMPGETQVSASTGLQSFITAIALPVQLGNDPVTLTSIRYCYQASPNVHLSADQVTQVTYDAGSATLVGSPVVQSFNLTDSACRTVALNRTLGPHDQVTLQVSANWYTAGATLRLGLVTATFTPS